MIRARPYPIYRSNRNLRRIKGKMAAARRGYYYFDTHMHRGPWPKDYKKLCEPRYYFYREKRMELFHATREAAEIRQSRRIRSFNRLTQVGTSIALARLGRARKFIAMRRQRRCRGNIKRAIGTLILANRANMIRRGMLDTIDRLLNKSHT